jgi:hypothetical protein
MGVDHWLHCTSAGRHLLLPWSMARLLYRPTPRAFRHDHFSTSLTSSKFASIPEALVYKDAHCVPCFFFVFRTTGIQKLRNVLVRFVQTSRFFAHHGQTVCF